MNRSFRWASRLLSLFLISIGVVSVAKAEDFNACKTQLIDRAVAQGMERKYVETVFDSIKHQPRVIELDRKQPEFVQTFPNYFTKRVTQWRMEKGREMLEKHRSLLKDLTRRFGVPAHYLVAFWGLETNFGSYKGDMPVLDSLATLACDKRRSAFFTAELLKAVKLLQRDALMQDKMVGSWAGAMGHTQFMPSAYTQYAIDGDNDGNINLWESEEDALASAANFLANLGWQPGYRWGREVQLPEGFDYRQAGYSKRRSITEWHQMGVTRANGNPLGRDDTIAYIVVPAGHAGPAFIAYPNFRIIMRWNNSEFYALAVGHLADRIAGEGPLVAELPDLPTYSRDDIMQLQARLNEQGYDVGTPDGIIGPATRAGIREFQAKNGMTADGFPGLDVMQKIGVIKETSSS